MRRLLEEEDLNLQDLIFILLFFFVISQTLIVFKVQKDLIVPPKVDKNPELSMNRKDTELITLIIDETSGVAALAGEQRRPILAGFDAAGLGASYADYCDPAQNKDLFLPTEEAAAYRRIMAAVRELKKQQRFTRPTIGLIADHRARYGTVFQVNVAVQELIKAGEINPSVKWKVFVDRHGDGKAAAEEPPAPP